MSIVNGLNVSKCRRFSFRLKCALCIKLPSVCSEMVSSPSSEFKTGHLAHLHFIAINLVILEGKSIASKKSCISDGESNETCRSEPPVQSPPSGARSSASSWISGKYLSCSMSLFGRDILLQLVQANVNVFWSVKSCHQNPEKAPRCRASFDLTKENWSGRG